MKALLLVILLLAISITSCDDTARSPRDSASSLGTSPGSRDTAAPRPSPPRPGNDTAAPVSSSSLDAQHVDRNAVKLASRSVTLKNGKSFSLSVPNGYTITPAAQGLKRVRFFAKSPDDRIFVTDMHDRTDNSKGSVLILDGFDRSTGTFANVITYMKGLRNPNSVAFYTDGDGVEWLYLALTDKLVRYRYTRGAATQEGEGQTLATFPDYGLSYKYGGWHLTRTIAIGADDRVYVSVGSSCNACVEKEEVRASIISMNSDGSDQRFIARGLRNAVGLRSIAGELFSTNMGSDHLGDDRPEDLFYRITEANYGWPYCYQYKGKIYADPKFDTAKNKVAPSTVPLAYAAFPAHASPLGFDYFDQASDPALRNYFLVALHGSSKLSLRHGYSIVRVKQGGAPQTVVGGFLQAGNVVGRPCDVMELGPDEFLFSDDHAGVVYYVRRGEQAVVRG